MSLSAPGVARGARAQARFPAPRDAAGGVRRAAFARARDLPAAARTAAPPSGLVAWSSPRSGVVARAELKSGGEGRYVRPVEDKSPMKDEEIYFDPADLDDDDDASFAFDVEDDDDADDDDDSWFFVPEGAVAGPVTDKAIDLFNIDDDDDDDDDDLDFGFARGFVETEADAYGADGDSPKTANKSNRRRRRREASDVSGSDLSTVPGLHPERGVAAEHAELTPKQIAEARKKEQDVARMLAMGVPEKLLRKLDREKEAVAAFNVAKKKEDGKRTHKRLTIVAGTLARRKLLSPSGLDTRPMMGMVRGATFDMIMSAVGSRSNVAFPTDDARWLDLFAGTGAIGIESLSRGGKEAHFVEMDPWVVSHVLRKNIATLGVDAATKVHTAKVETFLAQHARSAKAVGGAFDFVSFCPPYYRVSYPDLLLQLDASPLIAEHTLILVEYARSQKPEIKAAIGNRLRRIRDRRYGRTYVALYACDGRDLPDEDDEWAEQPEEATRFGKVVRGGGKRDDA